MAFQQFQSASASGVDKVTTASVSDPSMGANICQVIIDDDAASSEIAAALLSIRDRFLKFRASGA